MLRCRNNGAVEYASTGILYGSVEARNINEQIERFRYRPEEAIGIIPGLTSRNSVKKKLMNKEFCRQLYRNTTKRKPTK